MSDAGRILVVCTGNVCRSPYIERLLASGLSDLGIEVSSAGTSALDGQPMEEGSARLLRKAGIDADDFVARQLTRDTLRGADLVLTASRKHRRQVVQLEPKALRYTYAIVDFSDLVAVADLAHPAITEPPDATLVGALAARAVSGRGQVTTRSAADVEVVDPHRKRGRVYEAMARQVGDVLPRLVTATQDVASLRRDATNVPGG